MNQGFFLSNHLVLFAEARFLLAESWFFAESWVLFAESVVLFAESWLDHNYDSLFMIFSE